MNEDKAQVSQQELDQMSQGGQFSSDDMAAMLGYITSLSQMHMQTQQEQEQPTDMQEEETSETPPEASKQPPEESKGTDEDKARDDAMEKEIADIRAELEALKQDDTTGTTTENTESSS